MKNAKPFLLLTGFFLVMPLLFPPWLIADSFRCGRKVIRSGDSSVDLAQKCGEPQSRDSAQEELWLDRSQKKVRVERWHYKQGSNTLARVVLGVPGKSGRRENRKSLKRALARKLLQRHGCQHAIPGE